MKKLLFALTFYSFYAAAQIPSGAVGDWPFDNNALDMSGNGSHGTVGGAIPAPDRFGQPNMAYRFNGVNSGIVVPNNSFIDVGTGVDLTFAFWMKSYLGNVDRCILGKHVAGTWNGYTFNANNQGNPGYCTMLDHATWYTASAAFQDACSDNAVTADTLWHFIVGSFDAANNQSFFYVDNVLQSDIGQSSGPISNNADLSFGYHVGTNGGFYDGVLDGVRMYKRLLTTEEMTQLFNEGRCVAPEAPVNTTNAGALVICNFQSTTLNATGTGTINWYLSPTAAQVLGTGPAFQTPILAAGTHTFYASATTCTNSPRTAITVSVSTCTGIKQQEIKTSVTIYPNPNKGSFVLRTNNYQANIEAIIINQLGQEVYKASLQSAEIAVEADLPNGVYFLKLVNESKTLVIKKLVIQD